MNNQPKEIKSKFTLSDPVQFLALGFGSGLIPKAPGTFGTLAAIPVFLLLAPLPMVTYLAVVAVMALLGIYICSHAAKAAKVHDHPAIVWDEIVGYLITMALIPVSWKSIIVGFLLFRLFDIIKPWPISLLDKHCHGGFGIMIDDIVAGFAAFICMYFMF
ncbi:MULTISPECIES: phosphatidylglycerophosphatase A family protein [Thalassotalea]|uniref:phosphatidylglycerophosphatase A family protein n=1 Tax=Thalassotalea TaxID=1518149 RepID=UPI0009434881|nr:MULTISPECIES: phosphatidylglycerophosphatase A [Thalassotalea]OKY24639.1 phosphatidylglycerophosphatase A [Thalassotalea sp. PP2-459]